MSRLNVQSKIVLLSAPLFSLLLSGCEQMPLMKFQDQRFGKDAPIYLSRDPNKKQRAPRDLTEEELKPTR